MFVMIALLMEMVASSGLTMPQASAQPLTDTVMEQNVPGEQEMLNMIMSEYQVSEAFIAQEQQNGLSLYEIYDVLKIAGYQNLSYEEAKQAIFTKEVNLSAVSDAEITNSLLPDELRDMITVESTEMTSEMLEALVQAENEAEAEKREETGEEQDNQGEEGTEEAGHEEPTEQAPTDGQLEEEQQQESEQEAANEADSEEAEDPASLQGEQADADRSEAVKENPTATEQMVNATHAVEGDKAGISTTVIGTDEASEVVSQEGEGHSVDEKTPIDEATQAEETEGNDHPEAVEEAVEGQEQAAERGEVKSGLRTMSAAIEYDMEEPKYNIKSFQQAPYMATSEQESISPLSGALSLSSIDVVMPGINGLNFALTRVYDTNAAQRYEPGLRTQTNQLHGYYIYANYVKKPITYSYDAKYKQYYFLEYDYNRDGVKDYTSIAMNDSLTYPIGSYSSLSSAQAAMNAFTLPALSKTATSYSTSSTNSFAATQSYSDAEGYRGTLSKSGSSFVSSGSYTAAQSKTATSSCVNTLPGKYNASGQWEATAPATNPCPNSVSYSSDGYTGTLSRTSTETNKACESPGTPNWTCTKMYTANYSGTVTKPAVDTRVYRQNYSGTVTIPKQGDFRPGAWQTEGSSNVREVYAIDSKWIEIEEKIATTGTTFVKDTFRSDEIEAKFLRDSINSNAGKKVETVIENGSKYAIYLSDTPNAYYQLKPVPDAYYYTYYNDTKMPHEEKLYPIGTGWSWDLPYMKIEDGKTYVHLQGRGTYEVAGSTLKNYEWLGLSLHNDTTVTVNTETSAYRLTNVQGTWKQYFASDGRLLRMADAYNNSIDFKYVQHPTYNRKLIAEISNNAGNVITISYSASNVTIQYNNRSTVYHKRTEEGMELLASVVDVQGRTVAYNYELKPASFNLIAQQPSRALSNPYALLKGIVHPTGALTEYQYESAPINRYIGEHSTNQYYRVLSRHDKIVHENANSSLYNQYTYAYGNTDMGSAYQTDLTIETEVATSTMRSRYTHLKDYVNTEVGNKYYLTEQKNIVDATEKTTVYQYNKKVGTNTYAAATPTTITSKDNLTNDPLIQTMVYNDYGNMTQFIDVKGLTSTYTYHPTTQLLASATVPADATTKLYTAYTYNSQGTVTQEQTKYNNSTGALIKQVDYQSIAANGNIGKVVETNADGALTYKLDYSNHLLSKISTDVPNGNQTSTTVSRMYTYDPATGALLSYKDGKGNQTSYQYDALGRIVQISYPDATTVSAVYHDIDNKVTVTDALNNKSVTQWNGLGWEKEQGILDGQGYRKQLSYGYTSYGQVEWTRDALNALTTYHYDKWGRVIETIAPNGVAEIVEYNDANRQVTTKQRSSLNTVKDGVTQVHDRYGRVTQIVEHNYEQLTSKTIQTNTYHPVTNNVIATTDAEQNQTQYVYDALGNLTKVIDALGEAVSYQYNGSNQLTKTSYANGTSTLKRYDALGRMTTSTDQQGHVRTFKYDVNHNLTQQTDQKGQVFTYNYDVMNRLLSKESLNEKISFTYNGNGQRLTMRDRTGLTQYAYTPSTGQLASVTMPDGKAISYTYNAAQQRASMVLPFGDVVDYGYDAIGRAYYVSWNADIAEHYMYNEFGHLTKRAQGNGMVTSYEMTSGVLSELTQSLDDELVNLYRYERDQNKNITAILKQLGGQSTNEAYTYDELNRIESATPYNETYSYDEQHNRRTLTSSKPLDFVNAQYQYDEWDRLVKVTRDGKEIQYVYNGDNLLVERQENGVTTRYYYDGEHIVAEGIVSGGTVSEKASYLVQDQLVLREDGQGEQSYYGFNGHGDVTELRDAEGKLQNQYDYDIWGSVIRKEEAVEQPFLYSGEYWDSGAQLQYLRARWYDPGNGRFISKDTYEGEMTNPLTLNLYTYVNNNPLIYVDPSGRAKVKSGFYDSWGGKLPNITTDSEKAAENLAFASTNWWHAQGIIDSINKGTYNGRNRNVEDWKSYQKSMSEYANAQREWIGSTGRLNLQGTSYVKFEAGASFFVGGAVEIKYDGEELVLKIKGGANGEIGAGLSVTMGGEINNGGNIKKGIGAGISGGSGLYGEVQGKIDNKGKYWEIAGGAGAGIGIGVKLLPIINVSTEGEYAIVRLKLPLPEAGDYFYGAPTYEEWMEILGK